MGLQRVGHIWVTELNWYLAFSPGPNLPRAPVNLHGPAGCYVLCPHLSQERWCVCVCVCVALCVCVCVCVWLFPVWVVSFIEVAMTSEKAPISTDLSTHIYSPSIRWGRNTITPTLQKERHKYPLPLGEGKQRMAYFFPRKVNIIISSPSLFIGQAKSQIPRICGIGCEKWQSNLTEFNSI